MRRTTSRASSKYKRVRTLLFASLCVVLLLGLYGFYQFNSFASRIYTPEGGADRQAEHVSQQAGQVPPAHRMMGEPSGSGDHSSGTQTTRRGSQPQPTPDDLHNTDLQIDPNKDQRSDLQQRSKDGTTSDVRSNSTPNPTQSGTSSPGENDYNPSHGTSSPQESGYNPSHGTSSPQENDFKATGGTSRPQNGVSTPSHGTVATAPEANAPRGTLTPNPFAKWIAGYLPGSTDIKKGQTFLLLGVDSRKGEASRSDTIVLATLPPNSNEVYLMSIPRDTRAQVPGHGWTKINHAMSYGGLPLMKKTVEGLLNIQIDHTVTLDFEGFRQIIDNMGGLDVTVEKNMRYYDPTDGTNIRLQAGQTLQNGKQALDYARFRADALADTGRMQRQQRVIRAMIQKGSEPSNWPKLVKTLDILGDHVKTDVPPRDWMTLLMRYSSTSADQVKTLSLTGENRISNKDNLWYFYVDDAELTKIGRQLQLLRRGNA